MSTRVTPEKNSLGGDIITDIKSLDLSKDTNKEKLSSAENVVEELARKKKVVKRFIIILTELRYYQLMICLVDNHKNPPIRRR